MSSQEFVAPSVSELVEVFEERAAELKFPELDSQVLRGAVAEVEAAVADVLRLEAELERARELLASKQDGLAGKTQRALAYARVYAEDDAALSERLSKILLPKARRPLAAKSDTPLQPTAGEQPEAAPRRKRASKQSSEPLFEESAAPVLS